MQKGAALRGKGRPSVAEAAAIDAAIRAAALAALRQMRRPDAVALQRLLNLNADYLRMLGEDIEAKIDGNFAAPLRSCLAAAEAAGELRAADLDRLVRAIVTLLLAEGSRCAADPAADADYARFVAALVCRGA